MTAAAVLRGSGDPTLHPRYLNQRNPATVLREWIKKLRFSGITRLQGDFILDASAFGSEQDTHPSAWGTDHIGDSYAPYPSALALNDNLLLITVHRSASARGSVNLFPSLEGIRISNSMNTGSGPSGLGAKFVDGTLTLSLTGRVDRRTGETGAQVPVVKPLAYIAAIIEDELKLSGVELAGKMKIITDPAEAKAYEIMTLLEHHESPPLGELLKIMTKESDNFLAEQIWRATAYRASGKGDIESARRLEKAWYAERKIGMIEPGWDGSGLSRRNSVSASEQVAVLDAIYRSPLRESAIECLAVSGRSGTLRGRNFGGSAGRVVGKTGTLSGVGALSGYIRDNSGRERYVFSLVGNAPTNTRGRLTTRQNQIMNILLRRMDSEQNEAGSVASHGG